MTQINGRRFGLMPAGFFLPAGVIFVLFRQSFPIALLRLDFSAGKDITYH